MAAVFYTRHGPIDEVRHTRECQNEATHTSKSCVSPNFLPFALVPEVHHPYNK